MGRKIQMSDFFGKATQVEIAKPGDYRLMDQNDANRFPQTFFNLKWTYSFFGHNQVDLDRSYVSQII